jgi:hypothetical protein
MILRAGGGDGIGHEGRDVVGGGDDGDLHAEFLPGGRR